MSDPTIPSGAPVRPPDWAEFAPLIDAVLGAPRADRPALILELAAGDSTRQRRLTSLVAECERAMPLLDRPTEERLAALTTSDGESLLPDLLGERYRTGRELGRGGMARVYLARDLKHQRDVAIKVIRPELALSLGHDRFLREIEIAARLNHPNIVPLHDSGEVGGSLYFVMPYEEGPSLRQRLDESGALPIPEALNVLRDVARALAYAHEHGVVHRDIKPDNVMLSGGAAVVTDFGIAKAVSAALTGAADTTLTQAGSAIGTPAYMAPEQATGDPSTDHRADIYSFGCLAFELLTGGPPFPNLSLHQTIAAHIATAPPQVTALRTGVSPGVAALIAECLEKDPAVRPQSGRLLLCSLDAALTTGSYAAPAAQAAAPHRARRRLQWAAVAAAAVVIVVSGWLASRAAGSSSPITLAVLPFGNIGADSAMEFIGGGLAEEVASALARVPGIQIKSRSGARRYRGQLGVDAAEAGARLKADYLMTGVVRQERGRWILSADVEHAADATSVWNHDFTLTPDEQAGAAETIAGALVAALRTRFPKSIGLATTLAANQRTSNSEAYRLYLRGQEKLSRRGLSVRESADLFREAIRLDTLFAPAYSGLSMALALFPYFQGVRPQDVHEELVGAARRALRLDSALAQPHIALGMAFWCDYRFDSAGTELRTAIQLEPRNVEARVQYVRHLVNTGHPAEALSQIRVARAEDPASALVLSHMASVYFFNQQMDSAMLESRRALETDSTSLPALLIAANIRLANHLPEEARKLAIRAPAGPVNGYMLAMTGDTAAARSLLKALDAENPQPWLADTRRAFTYLGLGDTARALTALERATDGKEIWPTVSAATDPMYNGIRGSPRFQALLVRVGLAR